MLLLTEHCEPHDEGDASICLSLPHPQCHYYSCMLHTISGVPGRLLAMQRLGVTIPKVTKQPDDNLKKKNVLPEACLWPLLSLAL